MQLSYIAESPGKTILLSIMLFYTLFPVNHYGRFKHKQEVLNKGLSFI